MMWMMDNSLFENSYIYTLKLCYDTDRQKVRNLISLK